MEKYTMIDPSKRHNCRCHFCGETRSVKYSISVYDPTIRVDDRTHVACCNRCFARYVEKLRAP